MTTKKIDETGEYLYFPGFTVVADVFEQNSDLFQRIYDRLQATPSLTSHYSFLPAESYHITSFSLYEQRKMTDKQFKDTTSHLLQRSMPSLHQKLEAETKPFTFRITTVDSHRPTFFCEVETLAEEQQRAIAEMAQYARKIPRRFHISLGYKYKDFESNEEQAAALDLVSQILNEVLPNFSSVPLHANQPKLCYFNDMTKFIPFDGSMNPFESRV